MNSEHALDIALLVLRVGLGLFLFAHGAQKLFGWFGGHGLAGTGGFFDSIGFRPGKTNAFLAGLGEAGGGLLLALGLFTPIGGAAVVGTMLVAASVHQKAGFFTSDGGYELPLFYGISGVVLAIAGPGQFSIDDALDYPLADTWIGVTALVIAAIASLGLITRQRAWAKANPAPVAA